MKDVKKRTLMQVIQDAFQKLWEDIRDAKWVIIFIIAYFAFGRKVLYSLCPMVTITGLPCPGCGLTRAGIRLLHLDFEGAFRMHPFIYVAAVYMVLFAWNRYIRLEEAGRLLKSILVIILIGMIVFYIWRMAVYFPGEPPMSYYSGSLLARIWKMAKKLWL